MYKYKYDSHVNPKCIGVIYSMQQKCVYTVCTCTSYYKTTIYTQNVLEMFFAEDCSVTDATFEDEILKIVKLTQGFGLTRVCIKEMLDL